MKFIHDQQGALSKTEVETFFKHGYVIVKNLFTKQEVHVIRGHLETVFKGAQERVKAAIEEREEKSVFRCEYKGKGGKTASILATDNKNGTTSIKVISWVGGVQPELLDLSRQDKVLIPVAQLLGSNKANHLINQVHYKMPGDEVKFDWHQDIQHRRNYDPNWRDVNQKGSFVQVLAAIDKATKNNGPLVVLPGSHQEDLFLDQKRDVDPAIIIKQKYDLDKMSVTLLLEEGDTVFMHPLLIHGSEPNQSRHNARMMLINGFSYPQANTKPYPGEGSTEEVSLGISKQLLLETNDFFMSFS